METFSFSINNPNNFLIAKDYQMIPFGHRCTSALACKYANIRNTSLPFDWNMSVYPSKIIKVIENNFEDFIPDVHNNIFVNKYDIHLVHFNPNLNIGIQEYQRRINRFNTIINQAKKIYFVYINEDYLYDDVYRLDEFNDKIFNEMLEFERFIKKKYTHIDYNILYFNFKQYDIPKDSNIINIVLHSIKFYDHRVGGHPYEEFRSFCGCILSGLFNTKLTLGYDGNVFNN
jgi:hypothetical protein